MHFLLKLISHNCEIASFSLAAFSPNSGVHVKGQNQKTEVHLWINKFFFVDLKTKTAECVRQSFPSVARQEQKKKNFTFRSGNPVKSPVE